jgi:actin-related protein 8
MVIRSTFERSSYGVTRKALRLADPVAGNYLVKWPIHGSNFNTRDYTSLQAILSDIELLVSHTLAERFDIGRSEYQVFTFPLFPSDGC